MQRRHRAAHLRIWLVLAIALPTVLLLALAVRRNGPDETPPVRLSPPPVAASP